MLKLSCDVLTTLMKTQKASAATTKTEETRAREDELVIEREKMRRMAAMCAANPGTE